MTSSEESAPPNVVLILIDDLGFAELGCYGSSIATPNIDRLAEDGVRMTGFHVTPLCSPTRACLLTGRNHHAVGMGKLVDVGVEQDGYDGRIPPSAATVARHLQGSGYDTFAVGKWHLAPREELSPDGPFDHWPTHQGFDRYYGFMHAATDQWYPALAENTAFIDPPRTPEEGYHLTEDLADQALEMLGSRSDPSKPFFLYFATGAMHEPHQAPRDYIDRYRGAFDHGWDADRVERFGRQRDLGVVPESTTNTERPPVVPAWDELDEDERRVFRRQMEVWAGFLTHTDAQIGRILDHLEESGVAENTLVLLTSDNGSQGDSVYATLSWDSEGPRSWASPDTAEALLHLDELGGPGTSSQYGRGWSWAGNTPFRMWKHFTWLGGVRTPFIARWPKTLAEAAGGIRRQFVHAVDVLPTILEVAGVQPAAEMNGVMQQPFDGASFLDCLSDRDAPDPRETQYFEMNGSRSILHRGWKATTNHIPWHDAFVGFEGSRDFDEDRWELFDLRSDFSEAHDRAADEPDRLAELVEVWHAEARRNHVLPMMDTFAALRERGLDL